MENSLDRELDSIVRIQRQLLSGVPRDTEGISFALRYAPCARAGGDFYNIRATKEHHYAVSIADIEGHGAGAAIVMAMFRAWLGAFRLGWQPIETVASGINALWNEVSSLSSFATAAFLEVNVQTGLIRSINCGHPPILVVATNGNVRELLHDSTVPLGILPELPNPIVNDQLVPGETLVLYTDGITEAWNAERAQFGIDRFREVLQSVAAQSDLEGAADAVMGKIEQFRAGEPQSDDQCLLFARIMQR